MALVIVPLRTFPFTFTVEVTDVEYELSGVNVPSFPLTSGGRIVRWDVRNVESATPKFGYARLGPSGTTITIPVIGTPGNAIHMAAGGAFAFQRDTERIDMEDPEWDTLILKATAGTTVVFTGTVSVWIPEGQTL